MPAPCVQIGILFSADGPYGAVSRSMINGALLAVEEQNASGHLRLDPILMNPGGALSRHTEHCATLLSVGIRHVVGCYTSSSRKEVIPLFEKADALLWYPSHYEIMEAFVTVVVGGADVFLGTAPAGLMLGLVKSAMTTWQGQLAGQIGLLVAVIIVIWVLPRGVSGLLLRERA